MKVIKRDGRAVEYNKEKIEIAIEKANQEVRKSERATKEEIEEIIKYIEELNKKRMLVEDIQDIIEQQLMDKKLLGTQDDRFSSESNIIIIYDGEIYEISSNFGVNTLKEYGVIGSGWKVAIGSLYTNLHYHPHLDKVEMVKQALIACGVNTIYCDTNTDIHVIEL